MASLAAGDDVLTIARRLSLTVETVRTYAKAAMRKLGAHTRPQAVALALTRGEIAPLRPAGQAPRVVSG